MAERGSAAGPDINRREVIAGAGAALSLAIPAQAAARRPNILVIVADDMGFTDLGAFGGEIRTPNLDGVANGGVRLTDFDAAPACSPTRAMLLSGVDHHIAGLGTFAETLQANQRGKPGYEGHLNGRVVTIAEVLRDLGYRTLATGKWHVGSTPDSDPTARGFERASILVGGGDNHFGGKAEYRRDGRRVTIPQDFYSSDYFAEQLIGLLQDARPADERPIFAYLAFTAPHAPLQAPKADIARYAGRYAEGWGVLRRERIAKARALGVIGAEPAADDPDLDEAWAHLSPKQKAFEAARMAVYAAMIDRLDQNVGRVLDHLRRAGKLDDTIVFFMSDNGAEGNEFETEADPDVRALFRKALEASDNSLESLGSARSYIRPGSHWARASNGPLRLYKHFPTTGGIRVCALFRDYRRPAEPAFHRQFVSVLDVGPTLFALAGSATPRGAYRGRPIAPYEGRSILPALASGARIHGDHEVFGWELHGRKGVRRGAWKAVEVPGPDGAAAWRLYDLTQDPYEAHDLAPQRPDLVRDLSAAWSRYAARVGVVLPEHPWRLAPELIPITGDPHA